MVGVRWGRAHTPPPTGIQGVVEAYQNCLPRVSTPARPPGPGPPAPRRGPAQEVVTQWADPRGFRGSKEARAGGASALLQQELGPASPSG